MYIIYVAVEELTVGVSFSRATILSATAPEYISLSVYFGSSVKNGNCASQVIGV
jgi:hypothetical protein